VICKIQLLHTSAFNVNLYVAQFHMICTMFMTFKQFLFGLHQKNNSDPLKSKVTMTKLAACTLYSIFKFVKWTLLYLSHKYNFPKILLNFLQSSTWKQHGHSHPCHMKIIFVLSALSNTWSRYIVLIGFIRYIVLIAFH